MPPMTPLSRFRFCPACGAAHPGPTAVPFRCAACGFLLFANPAAAVGVFIEDDAGRVLFVRRAKDPGRGLLGLPGGFVDVGESAEDALAREVREEVGLRLAAWRFLCSQPNRYEFQGVVYAVLDVFLVARAVAGPAQADPGEVAGMAWLDPRQVPPADLAFPSTRAALACYLAGPA